MKNSSFSPKAPNSRGAFIMHPTASSTNHSIARTLIFKTKSTEAVEFPFSDSEIFDQNLSIQLDKIATPRVLIGGQSSTLDHNSSVLALEQNSTLAVDEVSKRQAERQDDVEEALAKLPPIKRWAYLAREQRSSFVVFLLATVAWLYSVMASWAKIELAALSLFSTAMAQDSHAAVSPVTGWLHMQDVLLVLLTIFVVWSLGTVTFASSAEKIKQAGDTLKTILGFVVGYFSSGKSA